MDSLVEDEAPASVDFSRPPAADIAAHLHRDSVIAFERHQLRDMDNLLRRALHPDEFAEDRAIEVAQKAYAEIRSIRRAVLDGCPPPDVADRLETYTAIFEALSGVIEECDRGFGLDEAIGIALGKIELRLGQLARANWDSGELRTRRGIVNLSVLVHSVMRFHSLGTDQGRIAFSANIGIDRLLSLDRRHVIASLDLLIGNAIAAVPAGGWIHIDVDEVAEGGDTYLQFSVTNSGQGIAQQDLDAIAAGNFTTRGPGHGAGLASANTISLHYMGSLRLVSSSMGWTQATIRWSMDLIPEVAKKEARNAA